MKKTVCLLLLSFIVVVALQAQNDKKTAVVAFYNLENLFDTENDPLKNDEQFLPEGDYKWTPERYQLKLHNMAEVISLIGREKGGAVVLGVSEVENEKVMLDLAATDKLKPLNYGVAHHNSPDRRGVDVAFFYMKDRFKVLSTKGFPLITDDTNFITRDQFLMTGVMDGTDTMHFIVNHWPSKIGGEKRSMPKRIAAAQLCRHIADSLLNANPKAKIFIMGDFNDNPASKSMIDYLRPKGKIAEVGSKDLFNPMWKMHRDGLGSNAYRDSWEMIDMIIISDGVLNPIGNTYKYVNAQIFRRNFMVTKTGPYMGYPFRTYAGGNFQGGYSDHFPVFVVLEK